MLTVKIDSRNLERRLKRVQQKLDSGAKTSTQDAGRYLRDQIKLHMPKRTGESANSIIVMKQLHAKGKHEVIVGEYPEAHPEKTWRGQHFDLPAWMMTSNKALKHPWHNGNIAKISTRKRGNVFTQTRQLFNTKVRNVVADSVKK